MVVNLMRHTVFVSVPGIVPTRSHINVDGFGYSFIKQSLNEIAKCRYALTIYDEQFTIEFTKVLNSFRLASLRIVWTRFPS